MKKSLYIIGGIIVVVVLGYSQRSTIRDFLTQASKTNLPAEVTYNEVNDESSNQVASSTNSDNEDESKPNTTQPRPTTTTPQPTPKSSTIKASVNLAVPFQAQAPFGEWVMPYKEACEEASLIMVDYYLRGMSLSKQQMEDEIDDQVAWQETEFGGHFDLPIAQVAEIAQAFYDYNVEIIPNLTVEKIKQQLNLGRPIVIPSAGRALGNPNFTPPGPLYHMLVIKGYKENGDFITNDPGTRNGANYVYSEEVLMASIRDWDGDSPDGGVTGLVM